MFALMVNLTPRKDNKKYKPEHFYPYLREALLKERSKQVASPELEASMAMMAVLSRVKEAKKKRKENGT